MLTPWGKPGKVFQCPKDPKLAWAATYPKGCRENKVVGYAAAALNISTDIVIFLLPLPSILNLQLNKKNQSMFGRKALLEFAPGQNGGVWWSADSFPNSCPVASVLGRQHSDHCGRREARRYSTFSEI